MAAEPIIYRIDSADRITYVSESWDGFALANNGAGVTAESVLGRSLWDFLSDMTTCELYRQVLARIRTGRAMTYRFRCDSPGHRRLLEMEIHLLDDAGAVQFQTSTLAETPRAFPPTDQGDGSHGVEEGAMIRVCGWCSRFDAEGEWMELEDALPRLRLLEYPDTRMLTHGICDACLEWMTGALV